MENDALILNMKDTSWDECVTLDHIATDADAEKLRKKGFPLAVSWEAICGTGKSGYNGQRR